MAEDTLRDVRKGNNFYIDNILIDEYGPKIGVYGIAIYNVIVRHSNGNTGTGAFPSHQTIARKVDCSVAKVKETIKQLVKLELLKLIPRYKEDNGRRTSNEYWILEIADTPPGYTTDTPPRVSQVASNNPPMDQSSMKRSIATQKESPVKEKTEPKSERRDLNKNGEPLTEHQTFVKALADVLNIPIDNTSKNQMGRLNSLSKRVRDAGYSLADIRKAKINWYETGYGARGQPPGDDQFIQRLEVVRKSRVERGYG